VAHFCAAGGAVAAAGVAVAVAPVAVGAGLALDAAVAVGVGRAASDGEGGADWLGEHAASAQMLMTTRALTGDLRSYENEPLGSGFLYWSTNLSGFSGQQETPRGPWPAASLNLP
jgi:hypothetical protein